MSMFAGHFKLSAPDGTVVDSDKLAGKPYALFFGFTHCPDFCPTTHGLRKAIAARLAENDATSHQIGAVTGHSSLEEVERYTRAAARARLADEAFAKLDRRAGSGTKLSHSEAGLDVPPQKAQ